MDIEVVQTPGLGNSSYLLASQGEALVVDPPRDAWRIASAAEARGWRLRNALETHVHNDCLSGAKELRRSHRVAIVAPADGRYRFSLRGVRDGDRVEVGDLRVEALGAPGHTPEHLCWLVRDTTGRPRALFSGGSLLMGGVGRTDLLGPARTPELTAAQFRTMRRLAELPDDVLVYPTHGAGSFCVAGLAGGPASATIGALRAWNPAFREADERAFAALLAGGRTRFPTYYRRMAPINRRGPRLLGGPPSPAALDAAAFAAAHEAGAWIVDARPPRAFADWHVSGSLNVDLRDSFAGYVGWLVPFAAPIVLVGDGSGMAVQAATELARIGYDRVVGMLEGGLEAWVAAGRPVGSYPAVGPRELRALVREGGGAGVLDVRQPSEWAAGAVPRSTKIFVADLPRALGALDRSARWTVACKAGTRAAIGASLLDAAGIPVQVVTGGGVPSLPIGELGPG